MNIIAKKIAIALSAASALALSGCATQNFDAGTYTSGMQQMTMRYGTVISVQAITLKDNGIGQQATGAGAVAGGLLGSQIGGGTLAHVAGSLVGLVGGAVAGGAIGDGIGSNKGQLITIIDEHSRQKYSVAQTAVPAFYPGERVQVIINGRETRVMPLDRTEARVQAQQPDTYGEKHGSKYTSAQ